MNWSLLVFWLLFVASACVVEGHTKQDDISVVHVIFMNHLDVGYSLNLLPGHVVDVLNAYFTEYFPRAVTVSLNLLVLGYTERFIYTTHPWLVSLYLDCPPNLWLSGRQLQCPDAQNKSAFVAAIQRGDITWHAGPMNMEFEMLDELMMEFSIQLSIDLDLRFNINRKYRTVSQRDVPGTTKAIIPILNKMGVAALSIGVNGATTPAAVPPVFLWQSGNQSLITMYHPGGYPNQYGPAPLSPGGLARKDCVIVKGLNHALCFAFRSDNQGPPDNYQEILTVFEIVRAQFPNAFVQASTFEQFIALLVPFASSLPVVTKEIGDVWIQGSGSDPRKTSHLRMLYRTRAQCFREGRCSLADERVYNASRFMLKLSEHTWGCAGNVIDNIHWTNDQFYKMLIDPAGAYFNATNFWEEQRNFSNLAIEALGNHSLVKDIERNMMDLEPALPDIKYDKKQKPFNVILCADFQLQFDTHGALVQLTDPGGNNWASSDHPMGSFVYHTYNQTDFDKFFNATTPYSKDFFLGIGKPNMSANAAPDSKYWDVWMESLTVGIDKITAVLSLVDPITRSYYGAPKQVVIQYMCTHTPERQGLDVTVQWFGKVPTRLPESLSFVFMPVQQPDHLWLMNKIEDLIDPLDVVDNGSQRLHVVNRGMYYIDKSMKGLEILSPDSAIVNILTDKDYVSEIPLPLQPINKVSGIAFNLYNNVWETNYIFWYPYRPEDINHKFNFTLNFI